MGASSGVDSGVRPCKHGHEPAVGSTSVCWSERLSLSWCEPLAVVACVVVHLDLAVRLMLFALGGDRDRVLSLCRVVRSARALRAAAEHAQPWGLWAWG